MRHRVFQLSHPPLMLMPMLVLVILYLCLKYLKTFQSPPRKTSSTMAVWSGTRVRDLAFPLLNLILKSFRKVYYCVSASHLCDATGCCHPLEVCLYCACFFYKCLDHMYWIQESSAAFLFSHPKPNSVVVSSSAKSKKHQSMSPDWEGRRQNSFGHQFYSLHSLGIKASNYLAYMVCYLYAMLDNFSEVIPFFPRENKHRHVNMMA